MIDFGYFLTWLRYRKIRKNRKLAQKTLLELNALTVTIHGRILLNKVIQDPDNGLPYEIRRMYYLLLTEAPIHQYSQRN